MQALQLECALAGAFGQKLAAELVSDFVKLRRDYATRTLERAISGKFVESFVQCAQQLARGTHEAKPSVEDYLTKRIEHETNLPEGIRICGARIARAVYALRSKRNVAHKAEIDPNEIDLGFCYHGCAWILAELLRVSTGLSMDEAGRLISMVQAPVDSLVEEFDGTRIFLGEGSTRVELLVLLHSNYPDRIAISQLLRSTDRRTEKDVRNRISEMYAQRLIHGDAKKGYVLSLKGHGAATDAIRALMAS